MVAPGKAYTLELTEEAARSCRDNPHARLTLILAILEPGDRIEITGDDLYMKHDTLLRILKLEGLEIEHDEYDGLTYKIIAKKPDSK